MVRSQNKSKNGETNLKPTCFFLLITNPSLDFTFEVSKVKNENEEDEVTKMVECNIVYISMN
jgi:hypothetical protein